MSHFRVLSGPFRGTPVLFAWKNGKRKILGIYEHETNDWWAEKLKTANLFYDVGAADGFFTRGVANRIRRKENPRILAFEPGSRLTQLKSFKTDTARSDVVIELIPMYVGSGETEGTTTLDRYLCDPGERAIVKIDVEEAELKVLEGAREMLQRPAFDWIVEIHGKERIEPVQAVFEDAGKAHRIIEPRAHWIFGAETRSQWTGWLVTE